VRVSPREDGKTGDFGEEREAVALGFDEGGGRRQNFLRT